jgi:hypothetical protein
MRRIATVLALVSLCACVHRSPAVNQPETTLKVQNDAFSDMTIYLIRGMESIRLGTANGNRTTILKIPSSVIFGTTSLRFQARPIAGTRQPVTEEIGVSAGDEVTMIIPPG